MICQQLGKNKDPNPITTVAMPVFSTKNETVRSVCVSELNTEKKHMFWIDTHSISIKVYSKTYMFKSPCETMITITIFILLILILVLFLQFDIINSS